MHCIFDSMNKPFVFIVVILTILIISTCITQKESGVESARITHLKEATIHIDGLSSDWEGIVPIYEDPEKSMFAVLSHDDLVIRMDFAQLVPEEENYFIEIDIDFDETADYRIEVAAREEKALLERTWFGKWKKIGNGEAAANRTVEVKIPLTVLKAEGFFLTGYVYDTSIGDITTHFPWVRSLYPETEFDPARMTRNDWKEDFEALYYLVKYNYPYLWVKERTHGFNWLDLKDHYMRRLDEIETNKEFFSLIEEAVATLQNGHTHLMGYDALEWWIDGYPGYFSSGEEVLCANEYWEALREYSCPEVLFTYRGGAYIATAGFDAWKEKYGIEEGSKVKAINGNPVDEMVESLACKTFVWCDCDRDALYVKYLNPALFGEDCVFTIEMPDGTIIEQNIQCVSKNPYTEFFQSKDLPNLEFKLWENEKTAYVRIRSFGHGKISEDRKDLEEFYQTIKDYRSLTIDIRGNTGGSDVYWKDNIVYPLAHTGLEASFYTAFRQGKYVRWKCTPVPFPKERLSCVPPEVETDFLVMSFLTCSPLSDRPFGGDIYLLVDRMVYSAAESFAVFAKESGFAQLVGTTTGGDGICHSPFLFALPNSDLVIRMASSMGINPDGTASEETHTTPDTYIDIDTWENNEELLEYVMKEIIGN
jgi:hypothetical protein